jgi:peroxiredoxin Q/BCP
VILGISFDTPAENQAFKAKFNFPFKLLSDRDRKVGLAYGATEPPGAGNARRISYLIGPDGKIAKVYDPVKPADHPDEVLKDLP